MLEYLKSEIDCIVETIVPLKKQGKRSKKKHLSKGAIRKIKYKQMMWRHIDSGIMEVKTPMLFIKMHLTKLQLKLEIQREAMKKICF